MTVALLPDICLFPPFFLAFIVNGTAAHFPLGPLWIPSLFPLYSFSSFATLFVSLALWIAMRNVNNFLMDSGRRSAKPRNNIHLLQKQPRSRVHLLTRSAPMLMLRLRHQVFLPLPIFNPTQVHRSVVLISNIIRSCNRIRNLSVQSMLLKHAQLQMLSWTIRTIWMWRVEK